MKSDRIYIKKQIKKRIEFKMNKRNEIRNSSTPKLISIDRANRNEIRIGTPEVNMHVNTAQFNKPYEKKINVDYDAVIIIASYNRFEKLCRILKQLHKQKTQYNIKIIVYNDGSTDIKYNKLQKKFPKIDYINNEINNGKYGYWKTITTLFKKSSEYISHVVIQIDDDFLLCDKFIDKLVNKFFEGKAINNKNVAIYYHLPMVSGIRNGWGMVNWIDGGALFDAEFLHEINYSVDKISESRWKISPEISSGVWKQISEKIDKNGLLTYKLEYSLANHDGNDDSKMNTAQRNRSAIHTYNFKKK